jgi:hypothetical protein
MADETPGEEPIARDEPIADGENYPARERIVDRDATTQDELAAREQQSR